MELFNTDGSLIPSAALTFTATSQLEIPGSDFAASRCNDGDTTTICQTKTPQDGDPSPALRDFYSCPKGSTALAKVVVHNAMEAAAMATITNFVLDFINAAGTSDRPSYVFKAAAPAYNILLTGV